MDRDGLYPKLVQRAIKLGLIAMYIRTTDHLRTSELPVSFQVVPQRTSADFELFNYKSSVFTQIWSIIRARTVPVYLCMFSCVEYIYLLIILYKNSATDCALLSGSASASGHFEK